MTTTSPPTAWIADLRYRFRRRPELPAVAVVAGAWVLLLVLAARGTAPHPDAAGMPGMDMRDNPAGGRWSAVTGALPQWELMVVAMMGPAALGGIRHTGTNSLSRRRGRAMAEYATGYLAVWTAFGAAAVTLAEVVPGVRGAWALPVALGAAAGWQLSPWKRRALRNCHRSVPLPLHGWRAERAAVRFGWRNGVSCAGSCWCLMLVMAVEPGGHLFWMGTLTAAVTAERMRERPRRATRITAAALAVAAVATAAVATVS